MRSPDPWLAMAARGCGLLVPCWLVVVEGVGVGLLTWCWASDGATDERDRRGGREESVSDVSEAGFPARVSGESESGADGASKPSLT